MEKIRYYMSAVTPTQSPWQVRLSQFRAIFFFWLVLILVTSTSTAPAGQHRTWAQGLAGSMLSWTIWALITPLIIYVDRRLPVRREALFKRFVLHIPLSICFTALRQIVV